MYKLYFFNSAFPWAHGYVYGYGMKEGKMNFGFETLKTFVLRPLMNTRNSERFPAYGSHTEDWESDLETHCF